MLLVTHCPNTNPPSIGVNSLCPFFFCHCLCVCILILLQYSVQNNNTIILIQSFEIERLRNRLSETLPLAAAVVRTAQLACLSLPSAEWPVGHHERICSSVVIRNPVHHSYDITHFVHVIFEPPVVSLNAASLLSSHPERCSLSAEHFQFSDLEDIDALMS